MAETKEKIYGIIGYDSKGKQHVLNERLSYEERKGIMDAIGRMEEALLALDYYYIVKGNFRELQEKLCCASDKQGFYRKLNRHLFNLLDSFYVYIKEYERFFKNTPLRDKFTTIKRNLYNKNLEYRMLYQLRNYSLHYRLPVDVEQEHAYLNPGSMLHSYGQWQKDFVQDLMTLQEDGQKIALLKLARDGEGFFETMQYQFFTLMFEWVKNDINLVAEHLCVENGQIQPTVIVDSASNEIVRDIAKPMVITMRILGDYAKI